MSLVDESRAMAQAAEDGRWEEAKQRLWRRADWLAADEPLDPAAARAAHAAGEQTRQALQRYRADLETEILNLRAARRSARSWRPYRETSGGTVDLTS